jgi:SAM-dependent methyltransferase
LLECLAGTAAPPARGDEVEVESGLLICQCGRTFPIERSIPELLPDRLRDADRDAAWLTSIASALPPALNAALQRAAPKAQGESDPGLHHKQAEIGITSKVADQAFFAPGYSSPFAYWDSNFSIYLLKLFGAVAPLLRISKDERIIDSGCGYAWTTEWLFRSGFDAIGVDICRTYLEVGIQRMGVPRPHLVVADVEALPFANESAASILAFESFHHIPGRPRAMRGYERVLKEKGTAILAEPGAAHEHSAVAIDAMTKYGILEKGMELDDVRRYCEGTSLHPEQIFLVRLGGDELGTVADRGFVNQHSVVEGNLFRLMKDANPIPSAPLPSPTMARDGTPVACAICGEHKTQHLYEKSGYGIAACERCGLVFANPRAPEAAILGRYSGEYFWNEYLPSLGAPNGNFDLADFDARHAAMLRMIAERSAGRRLLEVGCGAGFFLKAAERAGWQVEGIELSEEAARFASERLQLPIRRERAEAAGIAPGSFDVAAMFDVIEHLFDPRSVLEATARALTPGGVLVVSTPNFDALSRHLLGVDWAVLSPLEHVYYFTEDSLRRLLEASGFSGIEFVRHHAAWGPQQTTNFRYTHAPNGARARATEVLVRIGGMPLARALQRAGRQDALLCFARKR